jgi:hypothetical protein
VQMVDARAPAGARHTGGGARRRNAIADATAFGRERAHVDRARAHRLRQIQGQSCGVGLRARKASSDSTTRRSASERTSSSRAAEEVFYKGKRCKAGERPMLSLFQNRAGAEVVSIPEQSRCRTRGRANRRQKPCVHKRDKTDPTRWVGRRLG